MFRKLKTINGVAITINVSQIALVSENEIHMSSGAVVNLTPESCAEVEEAMFPLRTVKTNVNEPKPELLELFEKLHKLTGGKGKPVFTLQREKKLKDLMNKHRLTEQLIIKAATNIGNDPFLQGDNDNKKRYGNIDYLLRPEKAASWSEEQEKKKKGMF